MRTLKSLLASTLFLAAAACGDDSSGGDDSPDIDADTTVPDGEDIDGAPTATRSGTIAITDIELTSADAVDSGLKGGAISIEFNDETMGSGGEVIYGTSPINGCVVTRFDADGSPNGPRPTVDAGEITISGPESGDSGLLKPVGPCTYRTSGYLCVSNEGTDVNATASPTGTGAVLYNLAGQSLENGLTGSYLNINGFTANATLNTGAGAVPIVAQPVPTTLTAVHQTATGDAETASTVDYMVINGAGPIPTAGGANADFLSDETTSVRVQKAADDNWGAIDFTTYVRGEGFELATTSDLPHEFPTDASSPAPITFSCATADGGSCGVDGEGDLEALIVSGRTTDSPTNGLPDYIMPPPTTEYATFQCAFLLPNDTGTVPMEAVAAILSTNPTRIETRVLSVAGTILAEGPMDLNQLRVLVGHGVVGHTTVP